MTEHIFCPECGMQMRLLKSRKHRYLNGEFRLFFACPRYPTCKNTHGAHPNGEPFGVPGDKQMRELRQKIHDKFKEIWPWDDPYAKKEMYRWLRQNTPVGHIGQMTLSQLMSLWDRVKKIKKIERYD